MAAREVLIVLYDGVQSLDVTGPLEVFTGGSRYQESRGQGPAYAVRTAAADGAPVTTSSGLTLMPADGLPGSLAGLDTLVVPGGNKGHPEPRLAGWLRAHAGQARRIASVWTDTRESRACPDQPEARVTCTQDQGPRARPGTYPAYARRGRCPPGGSPSLERAGLWPPRVTWPGCPRSGPPGRPAPPGAGAAPIEEATCQDRRRPCTCRTAAEAR